MATYPNLSLDVMQPQIETPDQATQAKVSIADSMAQLQERQARAKDYAAQAPIRQAQAANQLQGFAEKKALDQAFAGSIKPYDPAVGDIEYDDDKAGQILDSTNIPGVGKASYLRAQYQAQKDQQRASHRQQAISELTQTNQANDIIAIPSENFLTRNGEHKPGESYSDADIAAMKAEYPAIRAQAVKVNPANGKILPYDYDPDIVNPKLQSFVDQHNQNKDVQQKLADAQGKEKLGLTTPEGRERAIALQVQQVTQQNGGKAPDQETLDAIREGVMQKAGFTGFKITRKSPGALKQFGDTTGDRLPAGAVGIYGEALDTSPDVHYATVMHPDGTIVGYVQNNKQFAPKDPTAASLALASANGDAKAAQALKSLAALRSQQNAGGGLTPEAQEMIARQFVATGILPSMGMGAAKDREAVFNRAGEIARGQNVAANSAEFKQLQSSTTALQKSRDAVVAFETTATKNLDNAINAAKKLEDTGSPILNKPLRTLDRRVLGGPEIAAFDAARQVAVNEIAKVTSNPTLSGQLSDTARREVADFIPEDATIQQIMAVAQILKQDMENRRTALEDQIKFNNGRIRGVGAPTDNAPPNPYVTPPLKLSPNNPYAKKSPGGG